MSHVIAQVATSRPSSPITAAGDHPSAGEMAVCYARRFWYAARRWWWSSYWRLDVAGRGNVPRRGAVLLCGNHTSHLDAPAILAALPHGTALRTSTAAAKDVFGDHKWRDVVSRVVTNALPIERGAGFSRGLRELEAVLGEDRPLILFPEGRRSTDRRLLEFKPGAAMLALRTGTPIVPIHIGGADGSLPRGGHFPRPHEVRVRFGSPIDPRPFIEAVEAGQMTRRQAYDRITERLRASILELASDPRGLGRAA
jgi:1-acyl-sn-glycerol-3-phosphate acyltransferase/long-chain acyl-CoA synthetase